MTVVTILDSGKKKGPKDSIQIKVDSMDDDDDEAKSVGKMELAQYFFSGAANGAWLNVGLFCMVILGFILAFLILASIAGFFGFFGAIFGAIFKEESAWIWNHLPRITDYACFIIIVVLEILIACCLHYFCYTNFLFCFKNLKTTEVETFQRFGTESSCWLLLYIQTPELLIHNFNYKNKLVELNFRRFFFGFILLDPDEGFCYFHNNLDFDWCLFDVFQS